MVDADEAVLLNNGQLGNSVTGLTSLTNTSVTFRSFEDALLFTPIGGADRVEAIGGGIDRLAIFLTQPNATFTEIELVLRRPIDDTSAVTFRFLDGSTTSFNLGNGQNYFAARTTGGDVISEVWFNTNGDGLADVRNVRIGGIAGVTGAVPEPGTWATMILGFGAIGMGLRTRRRQTKVRVRFG